MLLEVVAAATGGGGGGVSTVQLLFGAVNALWGLVLTIGLVLRKRYEGEIEDLKKRNEKYELQNERGLQALEQSVAISDRQNETIKLVVEKHGALLENIATQLSEAKTTATRRARTP